MSQIKIPREEQNSQAFMAENHLKTLAIQGEFCGASIQGNRLKLSTPEWFVFTVINEQRVRLEQKLKTASLSIHRTVKFFV